jgi:hypothetical protein
MSVTFPSSQLNSVTLIGAAKAEDARLPEEERASEVGPPSDWSASVDGAAPVGNRSVAQTDNFDKPVSAQAPDRMQQSFEAVMEQKRVFFATPDQLQQLKSLSVQTPREFVEQKIIEKGLDPKKMVSVESGQRSHGLGFVSTYEKVPLADAVMRNRASQWDWPYGSVQEGYFSYLENFSANLERSGAVEQYNKIIPSILNASAQADDSLSNQGKSLVADFVAGKGGVVAATATIKNYTMSGAFFITPAGENAKWKGIGGDIQGVLAVQRSDGGFVFHEMTSDQDAFDFLGSREVSKNYGSRFSHYARQDSNNPILNGRSIGEVFELFQRNKEGRGGTFDNYVSPKDARNYLYTAHHEKTYTKDELGSALLNQTMIVNLSDGDTDLTSQVESNLQEAAQHLNTLAMVTGFFGVLGVAAPTSLPLTVLGLTALATSGATVGIDAYEAAEADTAEKRASAAINLGLGVSTLALSALTPVGEAFGSKKGVVGKIPSSRPRHLLSESHGRNVVEVLDASKLLSSKPVSEKLDLEPRGIATIEGVDLPVFGSNEGHWLAFKDGRWNAVEYNNSGIKLRPVENQDLSHTINGKPTLKADGHVYAPGDPVPDMSGLPAAVVMAGKPLKTGEGRSVAIADIGGEPRLVTRSSTGELVPYSTAGTKDESRRSSPPLLDPGHVLNKRIIQAALHSPEQARLTGEIYNLDRELQILDHQLKSRSDFVNEIQTKIDKGVSISVDELKAVSLAKEDVTGIIKRLDQLKKERKELVTSLQKELEANPPAERINTLWEYVKERYIEKPDSASNFNMKAAIDYRRKLMDSLIKEEASRLQIPVDGMPDQAHTVPKAIGSTALTSDRDINIAVKNASQGKDAELVDAVNTRFRKIFGEDSGSYFDTNLYNEGLMPDVDRIKNGKPVDVWNNPDAAALNAKNQDLLALMKQRRFFISNDEWSEHVGATAQQMKNAGASEAQIKSFTSQGDEANYLVEKSNVMVADRISELIGKYPDVSYPALELMASNELYVEHLYLANRLMNEANGDEIKIAEARFTMGLSHYFANEAGMSEGVLRDVVINGQEIPNAINPQLLKDGKPVIGPMNLNSDQLLQSFNENVGESLKEFNHYDNDIGQAAIHGSKYIGRLARTLEQLSEKVEINRQSLAPVLDWTEKLLKAERGIDLGADGKAGLLDLRKNEKINELADHFGISVDRADLEKTKKEIALAILQESGLSILTKVAELRSMIKEIGQAVNAVIRSKT